jgi:hypothetical protein
LALTNRDGEACEGRTTLGVAKLGIVLFAALGWVWIFLVYLRLKLAENNF